MPGNISDEEGMAVEQNERVGEEAKMAKAI